MTITSRPRFFVKGTMSPVLTFASDLNHFGQGIRDVTRLPELELRIENLLVLIDDLFWIVHY